MYELVKGITSMHNHGIMHRSLNPKAIWIEIEDGEFVTEKSQGFVWEELQGLYEEGRGVLVRISRIALGSGYLLSFC